MEAIFGDDVLGCRTTTSGRVVQLRVRSDAVLTALLPPDYPHVPPLYELDERWASMPDAHTLIDRLDALFEPVCRRPRASVEWMPVTVRGVGWLLRLLTLMMTWVYKPFELAACFMPILCVLDLIGCLPFSTG